MSETLNANTSKAKAIQIAVSPAREIGGSDALYVLFDDGTIRRFWWNHSRGAIGAKLDEKAL
jgi:hypothetical protein